MVRTLSFLCILLLVYSCSDHTPRPIGYNRIERADSTYKNLSDIHFSFKYSDQANIDSVYSENETNKWFNIIYPQYNARIYCSYMSISKSTLKQALEDSYRFAYSHALKADDIEQVIYQISNHNTYGTVYNIDGNVATPVQFFLTDSVSNFFRASLYYDIQVNEDSVAPVTQFIKKDIIRMIESFEWK